MKEFDKKDYEKFVKSRYPNSSAIREMVQSPYILEEHEIRATSMDVFSRLLMDRQIFFSSAVSDESAAIVVAQLLYLDSIGDSDITMYVLSPGGSCSAGASIIDTMGFIKSDISTINVGMAASYGAVIAACGTRGKRLTLPNASYLVHAPLISGGGITGSTADILIEAKEMEKLRERLFKILSQRTGQAYEKNMSGCSA